MPAKEASLAPRFTLAKNGVMKRSKKPSFPVVSTRRSRELRVYQDELQRTSTVIMVFRRLQFAFLREEVYIKLLFCVNFCECKMFLFSL